jgi:hypothetical protein
MSARGDRIKLTVEIPRALWKRVKHQGIEEGRDLWLIVTEALEAYLAKAEKKGGAK